MGSHPASMEPGKDRGSERAAGRPSDETTGSMGEVIAKKQPEQEQEWQITFDAIRDVVMILDNEFRILQVNAAAPAFFNRPFEEILGRSCYGLMHGTSAPLPGCPFQKAIRTGEHEEAEIYDRNGDRWLLVSADPIFDGNGKVRSLVHTVRDITKHKCAERALVDSEERFRLATKAISGSVYDCDWPRGAFICSEGLATIVGYLPDGVALTVAWWLDQIHPEDRDRFCGELHEAFARRLSTQRYEYRVRHKEGHFIWVEDKHRIIYSEDGQPSRLIGCTVSIDARRKAEQQLKEGEERLRLAAEAARMFAFEWDPATDQMLRSAESVDILGVSTSFEKGEASLARLHPDDRSTLRRLIQELSPQNPKYRTSCRLTRPDGQVIWLQESARGFFNADGKLVKLVGMSADVTDANRAEEEARQLRDEMARMSHISAMGELTATIAHELNQPLGAIVANAQACQRLLNRSAPDIEEVRAALTDMVADASRADTVVRRIREFLRRGESPRERTDLNEVVRSVLPMLEARLVKDSVALTLDLEPDVPPVIAGFGQLQQVIFNLILNAVDAVAPRPVSSRKVKVSSRIQPDGTLSLAVQDSGIGVSAENLGRLFDPFFTTKAAGTGMGLPICKSIVEAHGGRLWAESDSITGSIFQFTIPASGSLRV